MKIRKETDELGNVRRKVIDEYPDGNSSTRIFDASDLAGFLVKKGLLTEEDLTVLGSQ